MRTTRARLGYPIHSDIGDISRPLLVSHRLCSNSCENGPVATESQGARTSVNRRTRCAKCNRTESLRGVEGQMTGAPETPSRFGGTLARCTRNACDHFTPNIPICPWCHLVSYSAFDRAFPLERMCNVVHGLCLHFPIELRTIIFVYNDSMEDSSVRLCRCSKK